MKRALEFFFFKVLVTITADDSWLLGQPLSRKMYITVLSILISILLIYDH